jgi:hypothetical protein
MMRPCPLSRVSGDTLPMTVDVFDMHKQYVFVHVVEGDQREK